MNKKTGFVWMLLITAAVIVTAAFVVVYIQYRIQEGNCFRNTDGTLFSEKSIAVDSNNMLKVELCEAKISGSALNITVTVSRKDGGIFSMDCTYYMGYKLEINGNILGDDYVGQEKDLSQNLKRMRMESTVYLRGSQLKGHPTLKISPQILSGNSESYRGNWILKTYVTPEQPQQSIEVNQTAKTSIGNITVDKLEQNDQAVLVFCSVSNPSDFYNSYMHLNSVDNEGRHYKLYPVDHNDTSICLILRKEDTQEIWSGVLDQDVREFTFSFARDTSLIGGGTQIPEGAAFTVNLK